MNYYAEMEFKKNDGEHAVGHEIHFTAINHKDAAEGVFLWIKNRQKSVPEHFGEILSVRVGLYVLPMICSNGYLTTNKMGVFVSWKVDNPGGLSLNEHIKRFTI